MSHVMPKVLEINEYGFEGWSSFAASVIIVTFRGHREQMRACLDGLRRQTVKDFEVVLVDNGSSIPAGELAGDLKLRFIQLDENYGWTLGRNVGAYYATSDLLIFLEDDGIPAPDCIEAHLQSYTSPQIVGVRGKYVPVTERHNPYNSGCYVLGERVMPSMLNAEGNCSVRKSNFIAVGGWSTPSSYAHDGVVLAYELTHGGKFFESTIYNPRAVIFHDNSKTIARSLYLSFAMGRNMASLERIYPDIKEFVTAYESQGAASKTSKSLAEKLSWGNLGRAALYHLHTAFERSGEICEGFFGLTPSRDSAVVDPTFFDRFSPPEEFMRLRG